MANSREIERTAKPSVLDRLIDTTPGLGDPPIALSESVRRVKASVLRDLEWLLNTRRIADPAPDRFVELRESLYHYGLPDTTSLSGDDPAVRRKLQLEIETCIRTYEPRLTDVEVALVVQEGEKKFQVRFVVEALLRMDPDPERVVFDTVLDVGTGGFRVSGDDHA
jgi:type VI secretion system protein ImpF